MQVFVASVYVCVCLYRGSYDKSELSYADMLPRVLDKRLRLSAWCERGKKRGEGRVRKEERWERRSGEEKQMEEREEGRRQERKEKGKEERRESGKGEAAKSER